jgi:hypothetical protein
MLTPGKYFPGSPIRLTIAFTDDDGVATDPTTVTFATYSPSGTATDYVYLTDDEVGKTSTGNYYADFTPDESGRWHFRWSTTGTGTTVRTEGTVLVQYSPWYDYEPSAW